VPTADIRSTRPHELRAARVGFWLCNSVG
jgi:hypothetical protein